MLWPVCLGQERKYDYSRMYTENFTSDFFEDFNMDAGTKPDAPKTYWERWAMNSYFFTFRLYIQGSLLRYNYWSL